MAKLTIHARKGLAPSQFVFPHGHHEQGKSPKKAGGSFPVPDRSHAGNAKARASQLYNEGKLSASAKAKVDAKANRVLGK